MPQSLVQFVHNIALTQKPSHTLVETLLIGFNTDYTDLVSDLLEATNQAYAGLNRETGDWCRVLLNYAQDMMYETHAYASRYAWTVTDDAEVRDFPFSK